MFNRIFWGFILIGIGIFFILDQRGIVNFDIGYIASTYWPLILIYFGLRGLFFQYKWGHGIGFGYLYPLILTAIGVYFLGRNIDYIEMSAGDFFQYIVPFILIIIGVIIILRPGRQRSHQADRSTYQSDGFQETRSDQERATNSRADDLSDLSNETNLSSRVVPVTESDRYHEQENFAGSSYTHTNREHAENHFSFIGDIHIGSAHYQLTPLNINHFIGDTVVDLTRAYIPDGVTKISVGSFIGDVKVLLPQDLDVEASVTVTSFLGEYDVFGQRDSGMFKTHREESPGYPFAQKKIQLIVNTFIGDFRIERI